MAGVTCIGDAEDVEKEKIFCSLPALGEKEKEKSVFFSLLWTGRFRARRREGSRVAHGPDPCENRLQKLAPREPRTQTLCDTTVLGMVGHNRCQRQRQSACQKPFGMMMMAGFETDIKAYDMIPWRRPDLLPTHFFPRGRTKEASHNIHSPEMESRERFIRIRR